MSNFDDFKGVYGLPVCKSDDDPNCYIKDLDWKDVFCGTYDECCDFLDLIPKYLIFYN